MAEDEGENPENGYTHPLGSVRPGSTAAASGTTDKSNNITVEEQGAVSPLVLGESKNVEEFSLDGTKRLDGSLKSTKSLSGWLSNQRYVQSPLASPSAAASMANSSSSMLHSTPNDEAHTAKAIVMQAWEWLHAEKQKRRLRRRRPQKSKDGLAIIEEDSKPRRMSGEKKRRDSSDSDTSNALDQLEDILKKSASIKSIPKRHSSRRKPRSLHKASSLRNRRHSTTGGSSDTGTEHVERDIHISTCETWLDNSRTLSRTTGLSATDETGMPYSQTMTSKERDAWSDFQYEILRIAHTLQLKRWRRVPLERSDDIIVERLSGALTNAVYTVSPPKDFASEGSTTERSDEHLNTRSKTQSKPIILLLRIYGPQVEHLIDRDAELQILRRLGRQNIGARLLGTFHNGRFEEYLHAKPLHPEELREPEVSKQIAKRMRELHDGIELTKEERKAGAFVWRNWDKWVGRCERIVSYIDSQAMIKGPTTPAIRKLRDRGFVCGTPWPEFRRTVERYRKELVKLYGGNEQLKHELIFSHNDTQYGNILRQEPPGESPLLLPANVHKQLVVIDFEYSNANTRGLEFSNHFTEWCYNYHHPDLSFECQTSYYPRPEEQQRFLRAYLQHQPQYAPAAMTPHLRPARASTSSVNTIATVGRTPSFPPIEKQSSNSTISSIRLDDTAPPARINSSTSSVDTARSNSKIREPIDVDVDVNSLMRETRLWRIANSAQWVAWGIVQARVPGLPYEPHEQIVRDSATDWAENVLENDSPPNPKKEIVQQEEEDEQFDYLSYAQSRAMFFWGDCVQQGVVELEELPESVKNRIKFVEY